MITRSYRHRLMVDVITDEPTGKHQACQRFWTWLANSHNNGLTIEDVGPEPQQISKARRATFEGWSRASFA